MLRETWCAERPQSCATSTRQDNRVEMLHTYNCSYFFRHEFHLVSGFSLRCKDCIEVRHLCQMLIDNRMCFTHQKILSTTTRFKPARAILIPCHATPVPTGWHRAVARSEIPSSQTGVKGTVVPLRGAGCPRLPSLFAPPQAAKETLQQHCRLAPEVLFVYRQSAKINTQKSINSTANTLFSSKGK